MKNPSKMKTQHSRKYALTGRLRVGKDYVAKACNGTVLGFADPLYEVGRALFGLGPEDKDRVPQLRVFYQNLGEWGKGLADNKEPVSVERATLTMLMRSLGPELCQAPVNWRSYGKNQNIWLEALLARAFVLSNELQNGEPIRDDGGEIIDYAAGRSEVDIFVSNVRFKFELETLAHNDYDHWHVMCSETTYMERLRDIGIVPGDQRLKHVSEMLATELDRQVNNILKLHPTGPKLKVIWNDYRPAPGTRLITLDEFKTLVKNNAIDESTNLAGGAGSLETPDNSQGQPDAGNVPAEAATGGAGDSNPGQGPGAGPAKQRASRVSRSARA